MKRLLTVITTTLPLLAAAGPASAAAAKPYVPAGVRAGYVVFDRQMGRVTAQRDAHRRFRSASVVKIMIAIDYLESHGSVPGNDLALLRKMLRVSDDDAATSFWRRGGQGRIVERMARKLRLTDTAPPPADKPGFWGYTSLSAMDVARTYRYLLDGAAPRVSRLVLGHLRNAEQCGSDGFDQYFGIPRAVPRPWAVKQGWSGYGSTPPIRCVPAAGAGTASQTAPGSTPSEATAPPTAQPPPASATASTTVSAVAQTAAAATTAASPVPDLGHPVLHTTGLVGPKERWIMVLLTAHPSGTTWRRSTGQTTTLARQVYLSGTSYNS
ncbi:hypothetical protein AB0395_41870 [Streptosporangium sp. NPDC051023]|uniref:hypothetical protein n=1 Tax=Streptosporangium sp. NPDC051023 TaxID=3155410 RepID=UPI00344CC5D3